MAIIHSRNARKEAVMSRSNVKATFRFNIMESTGYSQPMVRMLIFLNRIAVHSGDSGVSGEIVTDTNSAYRQSIPDSRGTTV